MTTLQVPDSATYQAGSRRSSALERGTGPHDEGFLDDARSAQGAIGAWAH